MNFGKITRRSRRSECNPISRQGPSCALSGFESLIVIFFENEIKENVSIEVGAFPHILTVLIGSRKAQLQAFNGR